MSRDITKMWEEQNRPEALTMVEEIDWSPVWKGHDIVHIQTLYPIL